MFAKKLIFIFLFSSFLFLASIFSSPIFAQTTTASNSTAIEFMNIQNASKKGQTTLERWSEDSLTGSSMAILKNMIGEVPQEFFDGLQQISTTGSGKIPKLMIGGAIGKGTEFIATLFTPPASGIEYIAGLKDNLLGKPAYAQGFGFKGLEFLLPLWKAARNIVYILSSIIFVVIGLMIILRVKISPQAVVTVQSAVPTVITTLILVTFSYAIAGLLIDVGNIIAGIVIALLYNAKGFSLDKSLFDTWSSSAGFFIISDIGQFFGNALNSLLDMGGVAPLRFTNLVDPDINTLNMLAFRTAPNWFSLMMLSGLVSSVATGIFLGSIGNMVFGNIGNSILSGIGGVVGGAVGGVLGGLIIPIILCIIIGIWLIKLYFGLIKVYVTLIFKIIIGPLEIAMGAFPNSKIGFSSWILDVFANIMVFPIVTIVFIILNILTDSISGNVLNPSGGSYLVWAPGLINSGNQLFRPILSACVGMAGLAMVSKLPDLIPQYIFMIKPSPFGQAIGENMKVPQWAKTATVGAGATAVAHSAASPTGIVGSQINRLPVNWQPVATNVIKNIAKAAGGSTP